MKHTNIFSIHLIVIALALTHTPSIANHVYANGISATNIATFQHNITDSIFVNRPNMQRALLKLNKETSESIKQTSDLYGHAPIYGEYNEYEFMYGHSGGENEWGPHGNAHATWTHFNEDITYNTTSRFASKTDMLMLDFVGTNRPRNKWGAYTGFIKNSTSNSDTEIKSNGGYVGLYSTHKTKAFTISGTATGGIMSNNAKSLFGTDEFINLWLSGGLNATYNIKLDNTFILQPGLYAGYTWVESTNYTSVSGERISTQNFNLVELSPALRAIKYIGTGWYGTMHVRYVMTDTHGGDTFVNGTPLTALESDNFVEYGLNLEKNIENFQFSASIIRRDGWHDGFGGNLGIKYIF